MEDLKEIVLYIPIYNCERYIEQLLNEIPLKLFEIATIIIVDNCSTDNSLDIILKWTNKYLNKSDIRIIKSLTNLGYSGSQKLVYSILKNTKINKNFNKVIMLHGDGQYSPELLKYFYSYFNTNEAIVYGYRSKKIYKNKDETPCFTYIIIKILNFIESIISGVHSFEWHSGFVMYDKSFLERVDLSKITLSAHIDGHLQYIAGRNRLLVSYFPIYKKYINYNQFSGIARIYYVLNVLFLMFYFRIKKKDKIFSNSNLFIIYSVDYKIIKIKIT